MARTMSGNPITAQATAAPVQRNDKTLPILARNAPKTPFLPSRLSTPESYCSGWPARKCSRDASKKAPDIGGLFACRGFF
jgi:hypothetical protein